MTATHLRAAPLLRDLAADVVADNASLLEPQHLQYVGEQLSALLLDRIVARGKLTYGIAKVFLESGHEAIREALADIDLLAGIPAAAEPACRLAPRR